MCFFSWKQWMTFSIAQSSTELDWKSSCRQIFWECCIYMEVASCWVFRKIPIQDERNNALAVFSKAITKAELKVYCTVDVQLHIIDSSCLKKKKISWKALWTVCVLQCLDRLRKMHLPKLSESCMDDLVELSWVQSCYKKKNRWQRLLSVEFPFSFFLCAGTSRCSGEGSCMRMLLLIHCIYSGTLDIKATDWWWLKAFRNMLLFARSPYCC